MLRSRALAFLSRSPSRVSIGFAVTVVSSVALVHCGAASPQPPVGGGGEEQDSGGGMMAVMDSSVTPVMDSTVAPPVDSGVTPTPDSGMSTPDANKGNVDAGVDSAMTIGTGAIGVSPSSVYFGTTVGGGDAGPLEGLVPCGTTAAQAGVCITNTSSASIMWSAAFTSGSAYYTASPSSGTVLPGTTSCPSPTFYINPAKIPSTSPVTSDNFAGTVEITTNAPGDGAHLVQLHETAAGVILAATNAVGQTFAALTLPSTAVDVTSTAQFTLTNNGNMPLTGATLTNSNPVFAVNPGADLPDGGVQGSPQLLTFDLESGKSLPVTVAFTPTAVNSSGYSDNAVYTNPSMDVLCAPFPSNIALSGTATDGVSVTTVGTFSANCNGAAAAPQTFTISNKGGPATFSASFQTGFFTLEGPLADGGTAPIPTGVPQTLPSGSITLTVVPLPIPQSTPPGAHNDVLSITTTAAGDTGITHTIALNETAMGAALSFSTASGFSFAPGLGKLVPENFTVTNNGNMPATYSLFIVESQGNDSKSWTGTGTFPVAPLPAGASVLNLAPLASTTSCDGTASCYPQIPLVCSAYSQSSAYPNECQPGDAGPDCLGTINLPEFCLNASGGTLYGTQQSGASGPTSANITIEATGYPSNPGGLNASQAAGTIYLLPAPGSVICGANQYPNIPLTEPGYCLSGPNWVACP